MGVVMGVGWQKSSHVETERNFFARTVLIVKFDGDYENIWQSLLVTEKSYGRGYGRGYGCWSLNFFARLICRIARLSFSALYLVSGMPYVSKR